MSYITGHIVTQGEAHVFSCLIGAQCPELSNSFWPFLDK